MKPNNQTDSNPWANVDLATDLLRGFSTGLKWGTAIGVTLCVIPLFIDLANVISRAF